MLSVWLLIRSAKLIRIFGRTRLLKVRDVICVTIKKKCKVGLTRIFKVQDVICVTINKKCKVSLTRLLKVQDVICVTINKKCKVGLARLLKVQVVICVTIKKKCKVGLTRLLKVQDVIWYREWSATTPSLKKTLFFGARDLLIQPPPPLLFPFSSASIQPVLPVYFNRTNPGTNPHTVLANFGKNISTWHFTYCPIIIFWYCTSYFNHFYSLVETFWNL